jgi:hypothetical protein
MRARRLIGTLIATVLATGTMTLVGTASPASAATATKIVGSDGKKWISISSRSSRQPGAPAYGSTISLSVEVVTTSGEQVYEGTVKVQRKLPGKGGWKTVKSASSAYLYDSIKAVGNAQYRAVYSGTANYSASAAGVSSKVQRKLDYQNVGSRRVVLKGKVSPKFHGKVALFKQQGKKWKRYKMLRTNKKGVFKTPLPAPRKGRYYWHLEIPKSKAFTATKSARFWTYSY